ncbi:MAG: heavy-metal-associated domain-containing protein [Chitinophagaceae bacterium]|nr:heavy-metal-associated domain-containing protein [Chitinophagaceae bacterium]
MKKLAVFVLAFFVFSFVGNSQTKKAIKTVTIQTPTVHCENCKKRIEDDLDRGEGIQKVVVDFKRKTTKVTYYTERTNVENIKALIANVGYDADDVTADPDAQKRLPKVCQKQ